MDAVCVGAEGEVERVETRWVGKDLARVKESQCCEGVVEHGGSTCSMTLCLVHGYSEDEGGGGSFKSE